ncbi:MAG: mechanosensitive ion channel family protein [Planctomycetota bacterium]|jgi:small conductance mechanosensitive channel
MHNLLLALKDAEATPLEEFMNNPWVQTYVIPGAQALLTLVVGLVLIKIVVGWLRGGLERAKVDVSLHAFLCSMASWGLKLMLVITVASMVGIEMMGFAALLAGAGLAIGLALQGHLQNIAGGVLILLFKPFKVGHVIETMGYLGGVKEIQVFCTLLTTPDNKTIIIPNGPLSTASLTNYTIESHRRVDIPVGIGYGDDIAKAREVTLEVLKKDSRILSDPAPQVLVAELGDNSVNFSVRVHSKNEDYWPVFFDNLEAIKLAYDANNISIPYPQRDVHLIKEE